jgi:coiled-coil and C2 domain-containing protein 1
LAFLLARQKEFRQAALQAKRKGEVNQAKEYLRLARGFEPLIEASNSGLPVDMDTVSSIQNLFLLAVTYILLSYILL